MNEIIQSFLDAMTRAGCAPADPADIEATGKDAYYTLAGDKKSKRGGYCLTIHPDGFAHGNFCSFKTGDRGSWNNKTSKKGIQKEEKDAWLARVKQADLERQTQRESEYKTAAVKAHKDWDAASPCTDHPYLTTKQVKSHGLRTINNNLIVPMYSDGKLWSYQTIDPDGGKLYLSGARKNGCYYKISGTEDIIGIVEGYSTGASVHESTGYTIYVAFDAYNLSSVADEVRKFHPNNRIYIFGDNDNWSTNHKGQPYNTGKEKAFQAAERINGFPLIPEFGDDDIDLRTDWNDFTVSFGHAATKSIIDLAVNKSTPVIIPDDTQIPAENISPEFSDEKLRDSALWKRLPTDRDPYGKLEPNSMHNLLLYLRHKPKYLGLFRYDRFAGAIILHREPYWQGKEAFKVRKRVDTDITYMKASMEKDGLAPSSASVREAIDVVAKENWINPPLEYFESLKWDGIKHIESWLETYLGATGDKEYLSAVGMCFLIAGVARIYDPGCKAENMLVLEGEQGLMKSTALATLANVGRGKDEESYFCDTLTFGKIQEKDTVTISQGKLIIEFAELASLGNREIEEVKSWMSIQTDEIRKPYGHDVEKFPRQFILAGSTNESLWLKDQTGNRRFWPVKCGHIDIKALTEFREQLWAEAVYMYKNKSIWWIPKTSHLFAKAQEEQNLRLLEDIWASPVEKCAEYKEFVTVAEILSEMGIEVAHQNKQSQGRVISVLKRLGYLPKLKKVGNKPIRGWGKEIDKSEHKNNVIPMQFEEEMEIEF